MAVAYSSAGAGAGHETNATQLALACPAAVAVNDILIAHVIWLDNTTQPTDPSGWTRLYPVTGLGAALGTGTPAGRAYVYGKIAAGDEDGTTINFGTAGGTAGRFGRIYSFTGYSSGTIAQIVRGFVDIPTETSPPPPTVKTTVAGSLAVSLICQDDNNAFAAGGVATGGTWAEPVAEFVSTTIGAQGCICGINTATPTADPGTIEGGTAANATADNGSTIGFEIRPSGPIAAGIFFKSAGEAQETETDSAALSLFCPHDVAAGDILIAHVVYLDNATGPSTPADWTLLFGPSALGTGTPAGRAWCFGMVAAGTEDASTVSFGTAGGTAGRFGRIYSFEGRTSGTITDCVPSFSFAENASETDPVIQAVTTNVAGAKAVALIAQDDNNAHASLGAVTGGIWSEAVNDYVSTGIGAQGGCIQLQVGTPTADPGTITGGTVAGNDDNANTICFQIRPAVPTPTATAVAEVSLGSGLIPTSRTLHKLHVRARTTAGMGKMRLALYEGAANITDTAPGYLETTALTTSLADYSLDIADADANAITSYADLGVRFWGYSVEAGSIVYEVDQIWLEMPEGIAVYVPRMGFVNQQEPGLV